MLDILLHFISANQILFDMGLLGLGLLAGRLKEFAYLIRIVIILVRIAQWYAKTHPTGKKMAKETQIDEDLHKLMSQALPESTIKEELGDCLGKG